jgi:ribosomal 50S subunit-associated protein YjgA (DUF615 family)
MQPSRLAKLELPDDVRDEITRTRNITAHIARKRQLAFLAKVMRRYEEEISPPCAPNSAKTAKSSARKTPPCIAWKPRAIV